MAKKTLKYKLDTAEIFTFVLYYKHGQGYSVYVITMEIVRIYILPITNQMNDMGNPQNRKGHTKLKKNRKIHYQASLGVNVILLPPL